MTDRKNWKLGASSCILAGWQNHTEEGFRAYKDAGITCAELSLSVWTGAFENLDFYEHPEKVREVAEKNGVTFTSFHAPFSQEISLSHPDKEQRTEAVATIKRAITSAAKIGIKIMVIHPSGGHYDEYDDRSIIMKQSLECVGEIYRHCESLGVTLAVENMTGQGICGNPSEMLLLFETYPNLKMCFDSNHCARVLPEEYLETLIKAGMRGRIATLHISDFELELEMHRLPGDGKINWEKVLENLEKLDYNGVFMYEVSKPKDREERYTPEMVAENFKEFMSF